LRIPIWTCLVLGTAGCALSPPPVGSLHAPLPGPGSTAEFELPPSAMSLTVGVEYLPTEPALAIHPVPRRGERRASHQDSGPIAESAMHDEGRRLRRPEAPTRTERTSGWERTDNPLAAFTLDFLDHLVGEDQRRLRRELGVPVLGVRHYDQLTYELELATNPEAREEEDQYLAENAHRVLKRPFRHALKDLPIVRGVELQLEDLKSELPTTDAWQEEHSRGTSWGHFSARVRLTRPENPLELTWRRKGLRLGANQEVVKVGLDRQILQNVRLGIHYRHHLDDRDPAVRADLIWNVDSGTVFAVIAGNDLDAVAHGDAYSLFYDPVGDAPGVLVYTEHIF